MLKKIIICCCFVLCGCAGGQAHFSGETSATVPSEPKLGKTGYAAWRNIPVGSVVKIVLRDGDKVQGRVIGQEYDSMKLDVDGRPMIYLLDSIWKVEQVEAADAGQ